MSTFHLYLAGKSNHFMHEIAASYAEAWRKLGHVASLEVDRLPPSEDDGEFHVVVAPHEFNVLFLEDEHPNLDRRDIFRQCFLLCIDQPGSTFFDAVAEVAPGTRGVLDISPIAIEAWEKLEIPALYLPLPYLPTPGALDPAADARETDFLFLGTDSPRRFAFFSENADYFSKTSSRLLFSRHATTLSANQAGAAFGDEREKLLRSAKILVNIHATKRKYFEWHRAMMAVSHGIAYVSEEAMLHAPMVSGEHFESAPLDGLFAACQRLIEDPDRRLAQVRAAHELFQANFSPEVLFGEIAGNLSRLAEATAAARSRAVAPSASKPAVAVAGKRGVDPLGPKVGSKKHVRRVDKRAFEVTGERPAISVRPAGDAETFPNGFFWFEVAAAGLDAFRLKIIRKNYKEAPSDKAGVAPNEGRCRFLVDLPSDAHRIVLIPELGDATTFEVHSARLEPVEGMLETHLRVASRWHEQQREEIADLSEQVETLETEMLGEIQSALNTQTLRDRIMVSVQNERLAEVMGHAIHDVIEGGAAPAGRPDVSVVIPLFNYGHYIQETLASVAATRLTGGQSLEVVVVDDGSGDDSADRVRAVMDGFPFPIRLVCKKFNTGLAEARNRGISLAAGEFLFMLDADNLLYPDGIARLLANAQATGAAAAYGMLAVFRDDAPRDAKPEESFGMMSAYDWDPENLVARPYIDAMALFRASLFEDIGRYDASLLYKGTWGWEDYEFWLRAADSDKAVVFYPNIVGAYRSHGDSMINSNKRSHALLLPVLRARYAKLIDRFETGDWLFGYEADEVFGKKKKKSEKK